MDIPTLANDIWNLLQPLLPVIATKGAEEIGKRAAGEVWEAVRGQFAGKPETQKLTEKVLSEPENVKAQNAFQYHLEETLESDPAFAQLLQTLLENAQRETYRAEMTGDGGIAQGENPRAAGAQSVLADSFRDVHYNAGPVTYLTQAVPSPQSEKSALRSSLPKQPYFFGREDELKKVADALSPEARTWGALIDGPGGIGKTALAIKAAYDAPPERFVRKIFITAKVRELTVDGEKPLTDFTRPSYLAMLDETAREIGEEGLLTRLPPEERPNALRLALEGKQALLIFDNLETLPEDERVRLFQFLARLPDGNKAIVTSRRRSDVDARVVRLDRLPSEAALQLMNELGKRYPRLTQTTPKERDDLYLLTQGNPLLMTWLAGQLGNSRSHCRNMEEARTFLEQAPHDNDPLEYIFGDLLETFSESYTRVLAALSHFENPAKLVWLAELSRMPTRVAETILEDLAERSVVNTDPEAYAYLLPPLAAYFLRARRPQAVQETGDELTNQAYALVMQYGGYDNYEGFKKLEAEWPLLAAALPHFLQGQNARLQNVCRELNRFLHFSGRWDDRLFLSQNAETRALELGDLENAGIQAMQSDWVYNLRAQPAEVLACAARVAKYWQDSRPTYKAAALRLRGLGYQLQKNYEAAIDIYLQALEIFRQFAPESLDTAIVLSNLASAERKNGDYPAAERHYRDALGIARKLNSQEGIATCTGHLAQLALDQKDWAQAEMLWREALALAEQISLQSLIARGCQSLAKALLGQDQGADEAANLAQRALDIYTYLRIPDDIERTRETLNEIETRLKGS